MNKRHVGSVRRSPLAKGIYLAIASVLAMPLLSEPAYADCTQAGVTVTCANGTSFVNYVIPTNGVTINVQSTGNLSVPLLLDGAALTASGNGITLNNAGIIDPSLTGGLSLGSSGAMLGNATVGGNTINVN